MYKTGMAQIQPYIGGHSQPWNEGMEAGEDSIEVFAIER
jgi:hypothetical protein